MRHLAWSIGIVLVFSAVVTAAEPDERGLFDVRVTLRPAFGYSSSGSVTNFAVSPGFSFQVSPKLSLRPSLGLGVSGPAASSASAASPSTTCGRAHRSPYLGGGFAYSHREGMLGVSAGTPPAPARPATTRPPSSPAPAWNGGSAAGSGLFVEIGQAYTPGERYRWSGTEWYRLSGWTADVPFRSGVGLTFNLK